MKVIKELGTLKDKRTALVLKDAYDPNFAIAAGYDEKTKEWASAVYYDGNLLSFAKRIVAIEMGIHPDRLLAIAQNAAGELLKGAEDWYREEIPGLLGLDEDETEILGLE